MGVAVFPLYSYDRKMLDDTIIAIATPPGRGGLGLVRLSGKKALAIAMTFFRMKTPRPSPPPRVPTLGYVYDGRGEETFDEALLTYFPAPHSYTREDVVELSCHGSPVVLEEIVRLGIRAGARHADPGEFTLRAYLSGRMDILQVEAVGDIIRASSLMQAKLSFRQLEGSLSQSIDRIRHEVIRLLSRIEAGIEFPEEGLQVPTDSVRASLSELIDRVQRLIDSYDLGKRFREGTAVALIGRANVGKSTLFNALLNEDRAIVTPFPGTTRDYLRENITIENGIFTLVDTAGMSRSRNPVERAGIERGAGMAEKSQGILLILDGSEPLTQEDVELLKSCMSKNVLVLVNKADLPRRLELEKLTRIRPDMVSLQISALTGTGIDQLRSLIHRTFLPAPPEDQEIILHHRQKTLLEGIRTALSRGKSELDSGFSEEFYVENIRETLPLIGQLTGDISNEDIIRDIFQNFCIGK